MKQPLLNKDKKYNIALAVVFITSVLLRFGLANFNREANDYHMPVIRQIMKDGDLPVKGDCSECFQPKLFYYSMAKLLNALRLDHARDRDAQVVLVQLINMTAGIITLVIAWLLIVRLEDVHEGTKLLGFSLLAFNPQFIGIGSQVTNDSLLIMFSTLLIYFAYLFLNSPGLGRLFLMVVFGALAIMTKTNGWVSVIAVAGAMTVFIISSPTKNDMIKKAFYLAGFSISIISLVLLSPLSQYVYNYRHFGSPVALNIDPLPRPKLFEKTYPHNSRGLLSVWDGLFTFKFAGLLAEPVIPVADEIDEDSPTTSLWTRLYASANSIHYENYPPSWRAPDASFYWVYRSIYIFALLPTSIMLAGAAAEIYRVVKRLFTAKRRLLSGNSHGLFAIVFIGHLLFVMLYAYEYRLQSVMKAVFIYPGLLSIILFFSEGKTRLSPYLRSFKYGGHVASAAMIVLLFLYIIDVSTLVFQLDRNGSGITLIITRLVQAWH